MAGTVVVLAGLCGCASLVAGAPAPMPEPAVMSPSINVITTPLRPRPPTTRAGSTPTGQATTTALGEVPATGTVVTTGARLDPAEFTRRMETANRTVKTVEANLDASMAGVTVTPDYRVVTAGPAMDMRMTLDSMGQHVRLRLRLVDGQLYLAGEQLLAEAGAGDKSWALASPDSSSQVLAQMGQQMRSLTGLTEVATSMTGAITEVTDLGPVVVEGVSVTHYRVRSTMAPQPVDLWLNSADLPIKVSSRQGSQSVTMTVTSYNRSFVIKAPDPEDVYTG